MGIRMTVVIVVIVVVITIVIIIAVVVIVAAAAVVTITIIIYSEDWNRFPDKLWMSQPCQCPSPGWMGL